MSMTIDEIVRKIRKSQNGNVHTISAEEAYELADCIEKAIEVERIEWSKMLKEAKDAIGVLEERRDAVEQCQTEEATCKDSLQVGNAAAMLQALKEIQLICWKAGGAMRYSVACGIIKAKSRAALAKPPRNCDLFGGDPKKLHDLWWEWSGDLKNCNADGTVKFTFGEWLLKPAEAKGGAE